MRYSNQVTISPLSTLEFGNVERINERRMYPQAFSYVQKLTTSDTIHIQLHADTDYGNDIYVEVKTNDFMQTIPVGFPQQVSWVQLSANFWYGDYHIPCSGLDGVLYVTIMSNANGIIADSWPFEIGNWDDTILLEGAHKNNDIKDTIFPSISSDTIFTFRVEGGFVPDGDTDESEYESIQDQSMNREYVYALPSTREKITFGDANGLPQWVRNKLRLFFCLSYLATGGIRIVRAGEWSEESTTKRTKIISIDVNAYDELDGEVALADDNGVLLATENGEILIL